MTKAVLIGQVLQSRSVTFSKWCYTGFPRQREVTEQKVYLLLQFLLSSVAPVPLLLLFTFLAWLLWICWTYFLQSTDGFSAFLKMFCSLWWCINRRTELISWCGFFMCVLGGKQRKEILNLNYRLIQIMFQKVHRIQLNALKKTEVVREMSRSLNRFSAFFLTIRVGFQSFTTLPNFLFICEVSPEFLL